MTAVKINFISGENDIPPTIYKLLKCLTEVAAPKEGQGQVVIHTQLH
jgi:hypothetical protein